MRSPWQDAELKVMVKKILEGANLEEVTMKSVCRQVYDSYPDFDLTHKKVFIKETVKSVSGPTIHLSSSLSLSLGVLVSLSLMCMYLSVYLAKEENGDGNEGNVKCI